MVDYCKNEDSEWSLANKGGHKEDLQDCDYKMKPYKVEDWAAKDKEETHTNIMSAHFKIECLIGLQTSWNYILAFVVHLSIVCYS